MSKAATKTFTHNSYNAAVADLKRRKASAGVATWEGREGWSSEGYWCPRRNRMVITAINPAGMRIV